MSGCSEEDISNSILELRRTSLDIPSSEEICAQCDVEQQKVSADEHDLNCLGEMLDSGPTLSTDRALVLSCLCVTGTTREGELTEDLVVADLARVSRNHHISGADGCRGVKTESPSQGCT